MTSEELRYIQVYTPDVCEIDQHINKFCTFTRTYETVRSGELHSAAIAFTISVCNVHSPKQRETAFETTSNADKAGKTALDMEIGV